MIVMAILGVLLVVFAAFVWIACRADDIRYYHDQNKDREDL